MPFPVQKVISAVNLKLANLFYAMAGKDPSGNAQIIAVDATGKVLTAGSVPGINIPPHDYAAPSYVGTTNNLAAVVYKTGGAGGATVATLTFTYVGGAPSADDARIASVTRT